MVKKYKSVLEKDLSMAERYESTSAAFMLLEQSSNGLVKVPVPNREEPSPEGVLRDVAHEEGSEVEKLVGDRYAVLLQEAPP